MAVQPTSTDTGPEPVAKKRNEVIMPDELNTRFLRVGDKLYRSAHDKAPIATISRDRIKAKSADSLPDLVRLAKANGWTSLKITGDEHFKRAAYLAASAQGLKIDGYRPDPQTKAAADRENARQAGAEPTKVATSRTANQTRDTKELPEPGADLAERFRRQTDAQNARDPELRRVQSTVAMSMAVAEKRFPGDTTRQREFVSDRKEDVASRLERGVCIAGVKIRQQQSQRIREIQQDQILQKTHGRSR